jgi:hypothetical protein
MMLFLQKYGLVTRSNDTTKREGNALSKQGAKNMSRGNEDLGQLIN